MLTALLHTFILASTYGSGLYGANNYNGTVAIFTLGPLSLPDTGPGWMVLIGSILVAIGGGWAAWMWQRRRQAASSN